jgi:hypothetical protein
MHKPPVIRRAYVYVATGAAYVAEAVRSAKSLRRVHPHARICLLTDEPPSEQRPFDEVLLPQGEIKHAPIDKTLACEVDAEEVLLLDSDTYIVDTIEEIFDLLARFDIAAYQDPHPGGNYQLPGVPISFSEFNTGVIAFNNTSKTQRFFQAWRDNYRKFWDDLAAQGQTPANDQAAFRYTLFHSNLRVAPLATEYHFIAQNPNRMLWKIRLVHGRGDCAAVAELANEQLGLRAYMPELGLMNSFRGRAGMLRQLIKLLQRAFGFLFLGKRLLQKQHPSTWWKAGLGEPDSAGK